MTKKRRIKSFIDKPKDIEKIINKWADDNNVIIINMTSHPYLDEKEYIVAYIVYELDNL